MDKLLSERPITYFKGKLLWMLWSETLEASRESFENGLKTKDRRIGGDHCSPAQSFSREQRKKICLNTMTRICCKITTFLYKISEFLIVSMKERPMTTSPGDCRWSSSAPPLHKPLNVFSYKRNEYALSSMANLAVFFSIGADPAA